MQPVTYDRLFKKDGNMRKRELHEGWVFKRGDIYLANLNPFKGSEQGGTRPVLLLQNNAGNHFSSTLIVAPLTSKLKKDQLPTHYVVSAGKKLQLNDESMVELEQIKTIDKLRILFYIGKVEAGDMKKVDEILKVSLGIENIPEDVEAP